MFLFMALNQVVLLYHRKCYVSFHGVQGVLLYHRKQTQKFCLTPRSSLSFSLLTCVVLVPFKDRSKQAMNDDRCDHCAQHGCFFHPLEHSLAIGRRSGALPRSRRRHRARGRTAFSAAFHGPAIIQATSAVECNLWYVVRPPHVALVCRCYIDLARARNFEK